MTLQTVLPGWRVRAVLALLLYVGITFALYGAALRQGWCCDDTQILRHAVGYAPLQYFLDPASWRALVPFSLTPWLTLTYDIDHSLFGFAPRGYYAHLLLSIALVAWAIHLLARRVIGERYAILAALVFLLGAPVAQASQTLMVRHYVEGALAWLVAMWLVHLRFGRPGLSSAIAAGLAFAVAASAKEVYLPLGLLPLAWITVPWRARLRAMLPLLLVMALYVPWRGWMLGGLLGGYLPRDELAGPGLGGIWKQAAGVPGLLFSHPAAVGAALLAIGGVALATLRAQPAWQLPAALAGALVGLALLAAPLLPLTAFPGIGPGSERYFFAAWVVFALAFAALMARAARFPRARTAVQVGLWLLASAIAAAAWQPSKRWLRQTAVSHAEHQAHFAILTSGDATDVVLASPSVAAWFVDGALQLRQPMGQAGPPPRVVADEMQLATGIPAEARLWRYDAGRRAMVDARPGIDATLSAWQGRLRAQPLSVALGYDLRERVLRWRLEPADGARFALLADGSRLDAPFAAGALRREEPPPRCFRIRRDGADGSVGYSPWLSFDALRDGQAWRVAWRGHGQTIEQLREPSPCPAPR